MAFARPIPSETFRQFDRLAFVTRRAARAGAGGEHYARRPAPSTDFVDYRPYQPGDDFRRVDWNVYGRLGTLQVKVTEGRERLNVLVILDCSSSMAFGMPEKLEFGAHLAAALAYVGMTRADSVSIACLGAPARIGPFARRTRTAALVRQLSEIAPTGAVDVNRGLASCLAKDGTTPPLVVIVSDLLTATGVAEGLDELQARRADVAVIHVVSPEEMDPNLTGELQLIDAE